MFGSLEVGLRLCFKLTKLNKGLMRPPELHHASTVPSPAGIVDTLFSKRRVTDSDVVASSAAAAAERLLNILQPRTVSIALAPTAFIPDCTMVESLLHSGWGLLDESLIAEPSCKVRAGLAHVAKQVGIHPPENVVKVEGLANSSRPFLDGLESDTATSATDIARAIVELENSIGEKSSMARSAALYGGAFIMERAVDYFDRTRISLRSSTANIRRTSTTAGLRRDSAGSMRHSTTSGATVASLDGLQDGHRGSSIAETWAGLASTHRLFDALRPYMPPLFFEGQRGRVIPEPSEKLRSAVGLQLEQEAQALRARGWLQPGNAWADLSKSESTKEVHSKKSGEGTNRDSSEASTGES